MVTSQTALKIQPLGFEDLPALLHLYAHLNPLDEPLPDEPVISSIWRELMSSDRHQLLGGFVDAELVSSCALTIVPNLTRGCRPYALIENVVTHTAHRRRGYGKAVLGQALSAAWCAGCYKVMLLTGRKDEATLRFYESAGFDRHAKQAFVARPAT
jgi:GNAT superfamily N-acetyltransferase